MKKIKLFAVILMFGLPALSSAELEVVSIAGPSSLPVGNSAGVNIELINVGTEALVNFSFELHGNPGLASVIGISECGQIMNETTTGLRPGENCFFVFFLTPQTLNKNKATVIFKVFGLDTGRLTVESAKAAVVGL